MRLTGLFAAVVICASTAAIAQDHLTPPVEVLEDYQTMLRQSLHEAFGKDVRASVLIEPSFSAETAVALRQQGARFEILTLKPIAHLWRYELINQMKRGQVKYVGPDSGSQRNGKIEELEKGLPKNPTDVSMARCAIEIDSGTAAYISSAWRKMLHDVRPPGHHDDIILDGVIYQFSMMDGGMQLRGEANSPYDSSRAGQLVALAYSMARYCQSEEEADLSAIQRSADAVLAD